MQKITILTLFFFVLFLSACAPSPTEIAEAEKIKLEAEAVATQTAIENNYQNTLNELDLQRRRDTYSEVVSSWNMGITVIGLTAIVCIAIGLLTTLLAYIFGLFEAGIYAHIYTPIGADTRARLVYPDKDTTLYPMVNLENVLALPDTGLGLSKNKPTIPNANLIEANENIRVTRIMATAVINSHKNAQGDVAQGFGVTRIPKGEAKYKIRTGHTPINVSMIQVPQEDGSTKWVPLE